MSVLSAIFQHGETIILALDASEGDSTELSGLEAKAKLAGPGLTVPPADKPVAFTFTVTPRPAAGAVPAGFDLLYSGASAVPGNYCTNVKMTLDGYPFKTRHLFFRVEDSAT
jgi:hypothetical protein